MASMIEINVAESTKAWLELLKDNGLYSFDGGSGQLTINEDVAELIDAMHEVLAGGSVKLRVQQAGDPAEKADMTAKYNTAVSDTAALMVSHPDEVLYI